MAAARFATVLIGCADLRKYGTRHALRYIGGRTLVKQAGRIESGMTNSADNRASGGDDGTRSLDPGYISIDSLRIRNQLSVGIGLTVIIPALSFGFLLFSPAARASEMGPFLPWLSIFTLICIYMGYWVVARHAINLTLLRSALEDLLEGEDKEPVKLLSRAPYVVAIEGALSVLHRHLQKRRDAEISLRKVQEELEELVLERTHKLEEANERLTREIEERSRAEGLKDEFVSTVSHELRTPLAITKEGVNLLLDEIPGPLNEKQAKILKTSGTNIDRLSRIINDLLDISKIEAGKMDLEKDSIDLRTVITETLVPIQATADAKSVNLRSEFAEGNSMVFADRDRLVQVLTNLISNALKFTGEGEVVVRTRQADDDAVLCSVEDTGIGLSPEEVENVFDKFTQYGRTHGAGIKGTGLGLAISKQIVELHRGRIWVESEKGAGSRFIFELPLYNEEDVVRETITRVIEQARQEQENFLLLLFRMDPETNGEETFREGMRMLMESQEHVRSTDICIRRGEREVILMANIRPDQLAMLYRRWESRVAACFMEVGALDVTLRCGYAEYPDNGQNAEDLLDRAHETMTEMSRITTPVSSSNESGAQDEQEK